MKKPMMLIITAVILCVTVFIFMSCETDSSTNGGNGGNGGNTAQLTMSVNPAEGGDTDPAIGPHTVYIDSAQNITATPAAGYAFAEWTATENATIADSSEASTTVTLTGNAEVTANFNPVSTGELVGVWNAVSAMVSFVITTNSNQTAIDIFSPCNGTVNVTGSENATLTYMAPIEMEGESTIIASDVPLLELMEEAEGFLKTTTVQGKRVSLPILKTDLDYPIHALIHTESLDMFMAVTGPADTNLYIGSGIVYNSDNYTLSADNINLPLLGFIPPGVTIDGTMQNITTNVPANTPTAVMTMPMPEEGSWLLDVQANGTFTGIMDEGTGGEPDTTYGTWEIISENNLMIIDTVETDTMYATYEFSGPDLILSTDQDACDEGDTDCLEEIEQMIGIDEGSLLEVIMRITATFVKL